MGGGASCTAFCGYHNHISKKDYYSVMPFPRCAGCLGAFSVLNAITGTSSHELSEASTDPVPGTGWYDNVKGEIGDICAWTFKTVAGHNVQKEWSNSMNAMCIKQPDILWHRYRTLCFLLQPNAKVKSYHSKFKVRG